MISLKLWLDTRGVKAEKSAPLKIAITSHGKTSYLSTGVKLLASQWDKSLLRVKEHPQKRSINCFLERRLLEVEDIIREKQIGGKLRAMSITQIKNSIMEALQPERNTANSFASRFRTFAMTKRAKRTREIYLDTLKKIGEFDKNIKQHTFDTLKKDWLISFISFMQGEGLAKNTINIHLRNIRAVFNDAIDNDITTNYPFRKIDMRPEETAKRSLSVEQLRLLFNYNTEDWQKRYVDYFKLSFMLIGINPVDLLSLPKSAYSNGRIIYQRRKTGRLYNIKVEREAKLLLEQYEGKALLLNFAEGFNNYKSFVGKTDKGLKTIGPIEWNENDKWEPKGRKHRYHKKYNPLFPDLSIYWCRHTWATIAYSLNIPDEIIAAALGHSHGNRTTAIYIDKSVARIDEANRKVLDYVLYGN